MDLQQLFEPAHLGEKLCDTGPALRSDVARAEEHRSEQHDRAEFVADVVTDLALVPELVEVGALLRSGLFRPGTTGEWLRVMPARRSVLITHLTAPSARMQPRQRLSTTPGTGVTSGRGCPVAIYAIGELRQPQASPLTVPEARAAKPSGSSRSEDRTIHATAVARPMSRWSTCRRRACRPVTVTESGIHEAAETLPHQPTHVDHRRVRRDRSRHRRGIRRLAVERRIVETPCRPSGDGGGAGARGDRGWLGPAVVPAVGHVAFAVAFASRVAIALRRDVEEHDNEIARTDPVGADQIDRPASGADVRCAVEERLLQPGSGRHLVGAAGRRDVRGPGPPVDVGTTP